MPIFLRTELIPPPPGWEWLDKHFCEALKMPEIPVKIVQRLESDAALNGELVGGYCGVHTEIGEVVVVDNYNRKISYLHEAAHRILDKFDLPLHGAVFFAVHGILCLRAEKYLKHKTSLPQRWLAHVSVYSFSDCETGYEVGWAVEKILTDTGAKTTDELAKELAIEWEKTQPWKPPEAPKTVIKTVIAWYPTIWLSVMFFIVGFLCRSIK